MSRTNWISTKKELPDDGEIVIIWDGEINVARFEKGISKEEREKMERGEIENPEHSCWTLSDGWFKVKRSKSYGRADEDGNNLVPYCWVAPKGPMQWFGQEVSYWMKGPEEPK